MASFQHEALLYEGDAGFAAGALPFIREGIEGGEPMLVAVSAERIGLLRRELGDAAGAVEFVDMEQLGRNPGRIIPAWRDFVAAHRDSSGAIRGIGEPICSGRSAEELTESQLHEALLNLAFADTDDFRLLCPYDRSALSDAVVREARCSHPAVVDGGHRRRSADYRAAELLAPFKPPLPPPRGPSEALAYDRGSIREVRSVVAARCAAAGIEGCARMT